MSCFNDDERNDNDKVDQYAYVDPSIRDVLLMETPSTKQLPRNAIHTDSYTIQWTILQKEFQTITTTNNSGNLVQNLSTNDLVVLADACDAALFPENNAIVTIPEPSWERISSHLADILRLLAEPANQTRSQSVNFGSRCLVATLLALNCVEGSIRKLVKKPTGKAPLLRDMVQQLDHESILPKVAIATLRTLLLPDHPGLNLRNLVWHGFLPTIPRRWLALSIILTLSLEEVYCQKNSSEPSSVSLSTTAINNNKANQATKQLLPAMRNHEVLRPILDHGLEILHSPEKLRALEKRALRLVDANHRLIPSSHTQLFCLALDELVHRPVLFASVMGPFVEHVLRIWWCLANDKNDSMIAKPGTYYVTLDGHGQKSKHEVVILPYLANSDENGSSSFQTKNRLVYDLGGSTVALLMDLFASPQGGPNLRAIVAHGLLHEYLVLELNQNDHGAYGEDHTNDTAKLSDVTVALLATLDVLCDRFQLLPNVTTQSISGSGNASISDVHSSRSIGTFVRDYYWPCYSYSALLLAETNKAIDAIIFMNDFIARGDHLRYARQAHKSPIQLEIEDELRQISPSLEELGTKRERIRSRLFGEEEQPRFTDDDFFRERSRNEIAAQCGASRLLLAEIAVAAEASARDIADGMAALSKDDNEQVLSTSQKRQRKQLYRKCASAQLALEFYALAADFALRHIEECCCRYYENRNNKDSLGESSTNNNNEQLLLAVVKRSRMVVSTFITSTNFDRALRALEQYLSGKAIKALKSGRTVENTTNDLA